MRPRTVVLCVLSVGLYVVVRALVDPSMIDFTVYRLAGAALRSGADVYGDLGAPQGLRSTYPPFAAIVFVPFSLAPALAGELIVTTVNLALVGVIAWQSCRLVGVRRSRLLESALQLAALSVWAEPVYTSLGNGQINLAVLALVLSDFTCSRNHRWRGVGVGLAAGLKVTPLVFIVYLLLTRRVRAAAVAAATLAATVVVSAGTTWSSTWRFWTDYLLDTTRVGDLVNSTNQSLPGLVSRLSRVNDPSLTLSAAGVLVLCLGLGAAVFVYRRLGDSWALPTCAVGALLAAPIAWTHHWVWCVPVAALLCSRRHRSAPLVAIFWTFALFYLPHTAPKVLAFPMWKIALTNWYVLFGVAFVVAAVREALTCADRGTSPLDGPLVEPVQGGSGA